MSTGFTRGRSMSIRRRTNKQSASARLSADLSALPLPSIRPFSQLSNISGSSDEKRLRHFTNHIAIPSPSPVHNIMSSPSPIHNAIPTLPLSRTVLYPLQVQTNTLKGNCSAKLIYGVEEVTGIQGGLGHTKVHNIYYALLVIPIWKVVAWTSPTDFMQVLKVM